MAAKGRSQNRKPKSPHPFAYLGGCVFSRLVKSAEDGEFFEVHESLIGRPFTHEEVQWLSPQCGGIFDREWTCYFGVSSDCGWEGPQAKHIDELVSDYLEACRA